MKTIIENVINFIKSLFNKNNNINDSSTDIVSDALELDIDNNLNNSNIENISDNSDDIKIINDNNTKDNSKNDIEDEFEEGIEIYNANRNTKYNNIVIFLTPGHVDKTPGKKSPDGRLYEWKYNREIVKRIEKKLDELGISHWNSHPEDSWVSSAYNTDSKDLKLRVSRINTKYAEVKKQNKKAIMLSVHVNAAGNGSWMNATGWSAWTTKGQNNSDKLADCLYDAAEELLKPLKLKIRVEMSDSDRDWESNFYVIKNVNCIAVLTENFFMDNKNDVDFLLSEKGMETITDIHINGVLKYIERYL